MLTAEEVSKITTDLVLGRPLRVKGKEAEKMAEDIRASLKEMEDKGILPDISREIPE